MSDLEKKAKIDKKDISKPKDQQKKPSVFSKIAIGVPKFLREMRSELKKVVWPTMTQLRNNTGIVFAAVFIVGLVIAAFDWCAVKGVKLLLDTFAGG